MIWFDGISNRTDRNNCNHSHFSHSVLNYCKYRSHLASTVLWLIFCCASTFSSNSHYRSLYHGPTNASYSLTGVSCDSPDILKRFYALLLPIYTFSHCLVHAMPPQSLKIDHLPSDASAILRERYLAGTFSVVTQWFIVARHIFVLGYDIDIL